jgi:hypothetical protein
MWQMGHGGKTRDAKAQQTHKAATDAIEAERLARENKTARLRALRLAKETVDKTRAPKR